MAKVEIAIPYRDRNEYTLDDITKLLLAKAQKQEKGKRIICNISDIAEWYSPVKHCTNWSLHYTTLDVPFAQSKYRKILMHRDRRKMLYGNK